MGVESRRIRFNNYQRERDISGLLTGVAFSSKSRNLGPLEILGVTAIGGAALFGTMTVYLSKKEKVSLIEAAKRTAKSIMEEEKFDHNEPRSHT